MSTHPIHLYLVTPTPIYDQWRLQSLLSALRPQWAAPLTSHLMARGVAADIARR